jgi:very-short-patch-repair endonuclease
MTEAEQRLWSALRRRQLDGLRFRRQVPLGRFIVDFACYDARVVIELDGGQHGETEAEDAVRTAWLEDHDFRVLRFWNDEVFENLEGVLEVIRVAAVSDPDAENPLPLNGGGVGRG